VFVGLIFCGILREAKVFRRDRSDRSTA